MQSTPSPSVGTVPNLETGPDEGGGVVCEPVAQGFYISTMQTGKMPSSFWANNPNTEGTNPVILKVISTNNMSLNLVFSSESAERHTTVKEENAYYGGRHNFIAFYHVSILSRVHANRSPIFVSTARARRRHYAIEM